ARDANEVSARELAERIADAARVAAADGGDRAGPEDPADNGSVRQHLPMLGWQRVQARSDQCVQRLRHRKLGTGSKTDSVVRLLEQISVLQQPNELLRVERVALGSA